MTNALTFSESGKFKYSNVYHAPQGKYIASARLVFSQQEKVTGRISPARFNLGNFTIQPENDRTLLLQAAHSGSPAQYDPYPSTVRIHIQGMNHGICGCGASNAEGSLVVELRNRPGLNASQNNEVIEGLGGGLDVGKDLNQNARGHAVSAGGNVTIIQSPLDSENEERKRAEFRAGVVCGYQMSRYQGMYHMKTHPDVKEAFKSVKMEISQLLNADNFSPCFDTPQNLISGIFCFYLSKGFVHKYVAAHLGLCIQQLYTSTKVSNKETREALEACAFSALGDLDDSIIPNKKEFFLELKKSNSAENIPAFLSFLDKTKNFLMFKNAAVRS
jgi:hypothetical protein